MQAHVTSDWFAELNSQKYVLICIRKMVTKKFALKITWYRS